VPTLATFQAQPGAPLTVLLVLDDLAAAERREAKMRWIIEGSAQGVIVRSTTSLIFANESVARMLGYESLEEFKQHQTGDIDSAIHPDDLPGILAATQARMERRDELSVHKFRYRRKDGSYVWLEAVSRFVNWQGTPAETSWISDISERERAERELIASKEEAEYANRSKTEFLANMSHELRTPLNAIIGFSEFMMAEMSGPLGSVKYAEYAGHIHESGQHLLSIINDILNLSRLEVGRLELVAGCVALMQPRAEEAGVTFAVEIPPDLPQLRADERAVKQILFNFLSNAVKFTRQGGRVTVSAGEEQDGTFSVAVHDTGIGMSESEIAIALAPFGQIDSKLARNHQGTGLGLPICESLMRLHGGALRIRSAPQKGTTMIASFPRERVVRDAA
jgi:PAS domain S-box-containing protein